MVALRRGGVSSERGTPVCAHLRLAGNRLTPPLFTFIQHTLFCPTILMRCWTAWQLHKSHPAKHPAPWTSCSRSQSARSRVPADAPPTSFLGSTIRDIPQTTAGEDLSGLRGENRPEALFFGCHVRLSSVWKGNTTRQREESSDSLSGERGLREDPQVRAPSQPSCSRPGVRWLRNRPWTCCPQLLCRNAPRFSV